MSQFVVLKIPSPYIIFHSSVGTGFRVKGFHSDQTDHIFFWLRNFLIVSECPQPKREDISAT